MVRVIASSLIFAAICLAGCSGQRGIQAGRDTPCATPPASEKMVKDLQDQNVPALEGVDVWQNEYGPGLKLVTAHYEIFTTLLEPMTLRRIPLLMESAYRSYNGQLGEPIESTTRFTIYLFADRQQWAAFTKSFAGEQAEVFCRIKAGAYCHNGVCVAYNIGRKRTCSVLGHEGWHQFNSRHFKFRLPSWLDEGVAMLFESPRAENGAFRFDGSANTYRLDALKKTLKKNQMIPLKELVGINPGEVLATNESEAIMAFYSQSYALVRFLRERGYGEQQDTYRRLLTDGLKGAWPLDEVSKRIAQDRNQPRTILWNRIVGNLLLQQYIGSDLDKLEQEYLAFCREIIKQK